MSLRKKIRDISDKREKELMKEVLAKYNLQDFNFSVENGHVIELDIKFKELKEIPAEVNKFFALQRLDLSRNHITEINNLHNLNLLKELILRENQIKEIKGLESLQMLESLDISDNKIIEIENLYNLKDLKELVLSRNKLRKIDGLNNLRNLKILKLNSNPLINIENLENLRKLEVLLLSRAKIKKIQRLSGLKNLRELDLASNDIEKIEGLEQNLLLKKINLNNNKIKVLENIGHLQYLEELSLDFNKFNPEDKPYIDKSAQEIVKWIEQKEELRKEQQKEREEEKKRIRKQIREEIDYKTVIYRYGDDTTSQEDKNIGETKLDLGTEKDEKKSPIETSKDSNKDLKEPKNPFLKEIKDPHMETSEQASDEEEVKKSLPKAPIFGEDLKKPKKGGVVIINKSQAQAISENRPKYSAPAWMLGSKKRKTKSADHEQTENAQKKIKLQHASKNSSQKDTESSKKGSKPPTFEVLNKNFETEDEWLKFANELNSKGQLEDSVKAYRNVLIINKSNYFAWMNVGVIFNNLGKYESAIKAFKQGLATNSNDSNMWIYIGISYFNLKNYSDAVSAFQQALKIAPDNIKAQEYYNKVPKAYREQYNYPTMKKGLLNEAETLSNENKSLIHRFKEFQNQYESKPMIEIANEFAIYELLAFTQFSRLWLAMEPESQKKVVLKHILISEDAQAKELIQNLAFREITLLLILNKTNTHHIIPLLDYFNGSHDVDKGIILKFPYYSHGTLGDRIKDLTMNLEENIKNGNLIPKISIMNILIGLLEILIELHSLGIIHRDIKPSNIIINSERVYFNSEDIKIIDFGIATKVDDFPADDILESHTSGTKGFSAPEQFDPNTKIGYNADVYAVGATIYNAMTLEKYSGTFYLPDYVHKYYKDIDFIFPLLQQMLDPEPSKRSTGIENLQGIVNQLKEASKKLG